MASESLQQIYAVLDRIAGPARAVAQHFRSVERASAGAAAAVSKIRPTGLFSTAGVRIMRDVDGRMRDARGRFVSLAGAAGGAATEAKGFLGHLSSAWELVSSSPVGTVLSGVASGIQLGVGAMLSFVQSTVELNSAVESTRIAVAGMLQVGGATGSWQDSMSAAGTVMEKIRVHAAALPGEAEDFVSIFRSGLPKALEAGLDVNQAEALAASFGAVGITLGVNVPQIGKDLNRLLGGAAAAGTPMWRAMSASISRAGTALGFTIKKAADFNKLDPADRARVLQEAVAKYSPMIDAFGSTWEAVSSTFTSELKDMIRVAGQPLFASLTSGLNDMNGRLSASQPLGRVVRGVFNGLGNAVRSLFTIDNGRLNAVFTTVVPVVVRLISLVGRYLFPVIRAVTRGLIDGFASAAGPLDSFMKALGNTAQNVSFWQLFGKVLGTIVALGVGMAVVFIRGFTVMQERIMTLVAAVSGIYNAFLTVGGSIVRGLSDGFAAAWEGAKARLLALVAQLPTAVKSYLGIHSPSRVFMELGANTAKGFELGVSSGGDGTQAALRAAVEPPQARGGGHARGGSSVAITVNVERSDGDSENMADRIALRVREELSRVLGTTALELA